MKLLIAVCLLSTIGLVRAAAGADEAEGADRIRRIPIILDTDIGTDIDDAFALALAVSSPEIEVLGVTTVSGDPYTRALIACRFLDAVGKSQIPVASGKPRRDRPQMKGQYQYGLRPSRKIPLRQNATAFLYGQLKKKPRELTLVAVGKLTNIAELITKHPDCKPWIKQIVIMGGAVRVGYNNKPPAEPEWNIKSDVKAAKTVFASSLPLLVVPLDATTMLKLQEPMRREIFQTKSPLTNQLLTLYNLWTKPVPVLYDPVAVTLCFNEQFFTIENMRLEVDDRGLTRPVKGEPNARVATGIQRDEFLRWYVDRISSDGSVRHGE